MTDRENITRGSDGEREYIPTSDPNEPPIDCQDQETATQFHSFVLASRSLAKVLFGANGPTDNEGFWVDNFGMLGLHNINQWLKELDQIN